jgi:hypothetical protein
LTWASKTPWIKAKVTALCRRVEGATMNDKIATAFLMAVLVVVILYIVLAGLWPIFEVADARNAQEYGVR